MRLVFFAAAANNLTLLYSSSQCGIFYLHPVFVTLKPCYDEGTWNYDEDELKNAVVGAKALVLNTPHNPTGKVFHPDDLKKIVDLCIANKCYIITDEIYEHSEFECTCSICAL